MTRDLSQTISWLHFGDLHITTEDQPNYRDFLALIEDANEHVADGIDFAVLPGDNADDGTAEQYRLIRRAIEGQRVPLEIRTGDHDRKSGTLEAYQAVRRRCDHRSDEQDRRIRSAATLGTRPRPRARPEAGARLARHAARPECERPKVVSGAGIHIADQCL